MCKYNKTEATYLLQVILGELPVLSIVAVNGVKVDNVSCVDDFSSRIVVVMMDSHVLHTPLSLQLASQSINFCVCVCIVFILLLGILRILIL